MTLLILLLRGVIKTWQISEEISCYHDFKKGGLTIITAAIFLAGEMAGSGVLALPYAILGTGRKDRGPNIYKDAKP
jgi:hypothetical protein